MAIGGSVVIVRNGTTLHVIEREPEQLPFVIPLLQRWMDLGFDPVECRKVVEHIVHQPGSGADESLLDPGAVIHGALVAKDPLLYPDADLALRFRIFDGRPPQQVTIRFDEGAARDVASLLRWLTGATDSTPDLSWLPGKIVEKLTRADSSLALAYPPIERPGIYRREHGCVVIRSATTSVMLDPVAFWMPHATRGSYANVGVLDAVFITHGHADHFNVASVLAYADAAYTTVVVPPVPRASLLAPSDMRAMLRMFGLNAIAPEWGSSFTVGDIKVDVLPFFGEQPVRDGQAPHADLRNWGSCYRFTTPEFTAVSLIDSGVDPLGDMADVVRGSAAKDGPDDFFLSSLPRFHSPFFFGLPHYYLALPFDQLGELFDQYRVGALPSVTPGPDGIVEVCRSGRPRFYLPYGNGFEGLGAPIKDVGMQIGEPPERDVVRYLADRFEQQQIPTIPIEWNPGDHISLDGGRVVRTTYAPRLQTS